MKSNKTGNGQHTKPTVERITRALNAAAQDAVETHRRAGLPLAVWRNGQVELIPPELADPQPTKRKPRRRKS